MVRLRLWRGRFYHGHRSMWCRKRTRPRHLGCNTRLIPWVWKQGKRGKATQILGVVQDLIEHVREGKFGKYQDHGQEALGDLVRGLDL